jgi:hypothetical protein
VFERRDLNGDYRSQLRLDTMPPVDAFWSLTMYSIAKAAVRSGRPTVTLMWNSDSLNDDRVGRAVARPRPPTSGDAASLVPLRVPAVLGSWRGL